jgi:1,4-alpha-glucan branching enzyme
MLRDACASWLGAFRMDGLRFDSANDLPPQTVQALTWAMRERFPGRILTAEARARPPGLGVCQLCLG